MQRPWGKRTFCVVTGASRGIGQVLAVEMATRMPSNSLIVLIARNESGLSQTKAKVKEQAPQVKSYTLSADLAEWKATDFQAGMVSSMGEDLPKDFDSSVLVHNAGTTGGVDKFTKDYSDPEEFQTYFRVNLQSVMALSSAFFKLFPDELNTHRIVINMTSLAAIQPMVTLGWYCTGKAAREMYFKVMAAEMPTVRVLNYSPGPVDTDMFRSIGAESVDEGLRKSFKELQDGAGERKVLDCPTTAKRLVQVLEADNYKSGDHVDYFDE